jgi:hypothetical protein
MNGPVARVAKRLEEARPLVRPTYNQLEVGYLPPFGDPEVHVPSEVGTYFLTGLVVNVLVQSLRSEKR